MDISRSELNELIRRLYFSRLRIMDQHPFFGTLLYDLSFSFNTELETFSSDGKNFYINPYYLKDLKDSEIDIVILHALMHIALGHHLRYQGQEKNSLLHQACDIVVNSNLMFSFDNDMKEIVIQGRTLPHFTPEHKEGYLHSVEEVYEMLLLRAPKNKNNKKENNKGYEDSSLDGDIQIDSFEDTNLPIQRKKIFKVKSTLGGKLYLRQYTFSTYYPVGSVISWKNHDPIIDFDFDRYTYDNLSNDAYAKKSLVKTTFTGSMIGDPMPIPCYSETYGSTKEDPFSSKPIVEMEDTYVSINLKLTNEIYNCYTYKEDKNKSLYEEELLFYLTIPDFIKDYFYKVNKELKWNKGERGLIFKIRNYVATNFKYDIDYDRAPVGQDPLEYFINISKKGTCVHFATLMMLMLRYFDIPSRIAAGYLTKALLNTDVDVYEEDAHAWVEVFVPTLGWMIIDPTPVLLNVSQSSSSKEKNGSFDSHEKWNNVPSDSQIEKDKLEKKLMEAKEISKGNENTKIPFAINDLLDKIKDPLLDWRALIDEFIQDDITDYSFSPPDNRMPYSDFILPSFSERDEKVKKVLFMVDTSASMMDEDIYDCFYEILGAIEQFKGKLTGYLGFFDSSVSKVLPFEDVNDIIDSKPEGRGGTNFSAIFKYVEEKMKDDLPAKIIILTDGEATYPKKEETLDIPVLWVINNKEIEPPWGKVVRLLK